MVKCWLMSDKIVDQQDECHRDPPAYIGLDELARVGVEYFHVPVSAEKEGLPRIADSRGYNYQDEVTLSRSSTPNFHERIRMFFDEHLHQDEEIRYIRAGAGYFDVRSNDDLWIRILSEPGDLIILPAGIYHRFTVDKGDFVIAVRLFKGEPVWTAFNRSEPAVDKMGIRREYVAGLTQKAK